MTKLAKIQIRNLKNVSNGIMNFKDKSEYLNIVGIYGQNGSGKTTLIDAVAIFQNLVMTGNLPDDIADYINNETAVIIITFENKDTAFEYKYEISYNEYKEPFVSAESLVSYKLPNYSFKKVLFAYQWNDGEISYFGSGAFNSLDVSAGAAKSDKKSLIFNSNFREWLETKKSVKRYVPLVEGRKIVKDVAYNINIHTEQMNGLLAVGNVLPLSFALRKDNGDYMAGTLPMSLANYSNEWKKGTYYSERPTELIKNVLQKISGVISKIVPNLELTIDEHSRISKDGESKEYQIEILTKRFGKEIPLRAESLGIQKLISILALLIEVYNNPDQIALVDELDSGIFEFLLGELVKVISDGAKGQLVFTSHNLRVLEELPSNKIYFSTNDPKNRYIKIQNVRESNNLRSIYLKEIQLDEKNYNLYSPTNTTEIKNAFYDAELNEKNNPFKGYDFQL